MKKGVLGINLNIYIILAAALAAMGQTQSMLLVIGFGIVVEKDKWLSPQLLQVGVFVCLIQIVDFVIGFLFGYIAKFFNWIEVYKVSEFLFDADNVISEALNVIIILVSVYAAIRGVMGKEISIPVISKIVKGNVSQMNYKPKAQPQYVPQSEQFMQPQHTPQAEPVPQEKAIQQEQIIKPVEPIQQAQPIKQAEPVPQEQQIPAFCMNCGTKNTDKSVFCIECGAKFN